MISHQATYTCMSLGSSANIGECLVLFAHENSLRYELAFSVRGLIISVLETRYKPMLRYGHSRTQF